MQEVRSSILLSSTRSRATCARGKREPGRSCRLCSACASLGGGFATRAPFGGGLGFVGRASRVALVVCARLAPRLAGASPPAPPLVVGRGGSGSVRVAGRGPRGGARGRSSLVLRGPVG